MSRYTIEDQLRSIVPSQECESPSVTDESRSPFCKEQYGKREEAIHHLLVLFANAKPPESQPRDKQLQAAKSALHPDLNSDTHNEDSNVYTPEQLHVRAEFANVSAAQLVDPQRHRGDDEEKGSRITNK